MNNSLVSKTSLIAGTLFVIPSLYGAEAVYEVQKGDTLSKIALEFSRQYSELNLHSSLELIKELNAEKFENYDLIEVGQKVRLPDQDYVHTFLAGVESTPHQIVKRKPFNPQKNLVESITSNSKSRDLANNKNKLLIAQKNIPSNYTIEEAKKLETNKIESGADTSVYDNASILVDHADKIPSLKSKSKHLKATKKTMQLLKPLSQALPMVSGVKSQRKESSQTIKTYLVRKGDTLSEIALRFYGAKKLYDYNSGPMKRIMELNPTVRNPHLIFAGAELVLPGRDIASESNLKVENQPKLDKRPEDELYWSKKERKDSLNPDFSYINFDKLIDIEFENSCENLTFKIG